MNAILYFDDNITIVSIIALKLNQVMQDLTPKDFKIIISIR